MGWPEAFVTVAALALMGLFVIAPFIPLILLTWFDRD